MSSQQPAIAKVNRTVAQNQSFNVAETILCLWEDNDKDIAKSLEEVKAADTELGKIVDAALELPGSDMKDDVAALLSKFQAMLDRQLNARELEAAASKGSLEAMRKKATTPGDDPACVQVFMHILHGASPDAVVQDLLKDFAANFVSVGTRHKVTKRIKHNTGDQPVANSNGESVVANSQKKSAMQSTKQQRAPRQQTASAAPARPAAKKQTETTRSSKATLPVASAAHPPKTTTRNGKPKQSLASNSPSNSTVTRANGALLDKTTAHKQARKDIPTGLDFLATMSKPKIRTYSSKEQMAAEKQQALKRARESALPSPSLNVETSEQSAQADQDTQEVNKATVVKTANKESDSAAAEPRLSSGSHHRPACHPSSETRQAAAKTASEDHIMADSATSETAVDAQSTPLVLASERDSRQAVLEPQYRVQSDDTQEDGEEPSVNTDDSIHASRADADTTSSESSTQSMANDNNVVKEVDAESSNGGKEMATMEADVQPTAGKSQSTDVTVSHDNVEDISVIIEDAANPAENVKFGNFEANKVETEKTEHKPAVLFPSRKGFLTVGMPGVAKVGKSSRPKPDVSDEDEQTPKKKKSSNKNEAVNTKKKTYKSEETIVDDDNSEVDRKNSSVSRPSKSHKHKSKDTSEFLDLNKEGVDLDNVIPNRRRKTTGGGSAPRNHTRSPDSIDSNKRKRSNDDDSVPKKKVAIEGSYVARPKTRHSMPTSDGRPMGVDPLSTPAVPATLVSAAPSSGNLGLLSTEAVDWDDDDL